jgi:hypothetical protein
MHANVTIGESREQNARGETMDVIIGQLREATADLKPFGALCWDRIVVACVALFLHVGMRPVCCCAFAAKMFAVADHLRSVYVSATTSLHGWHHVSALGSLWNVTHLYGTMGAYFIMERDTSLWYDGCLLHYGT